LYEGGIGVRQNIQKALELYGKGCDMRDQKVCDSYAKLKRTIDVK
jgi:TPR repeat protein